MPQCVDHLKTGGRMAVISFHSLEDRMVKHFMRDMAQGDKLPKGVPIRAADVPQGRVRLIGKPVYASDEEVAGESARTQCGVACGGAFRWLGSMSCYSFWSSRARWG